MKPNPLANIQPLNAHVAIHQKKDVAMADVATQFIGVSAAPVGTPSSTRNYTAAWGDRANTGCYTHSDIIMVSGSGPWRGVTMEGINKTFQTHYRTNLDMAAQVQAIFVIGEATGTDKLVAEYLQLRWGYSARPDKQRGFIWLIPF